MNLDRADVVYFGALVVAIILHEISHGVVALWFGDDTAKRAGRLTLNPVPHIDPFGSVIIPALGVIAGIPVIGWAKPVPVNPARLRHSRRDMLYVSLAGPGTNFTLALIAAVIARWQYEAAGSPDFFFTRDLPIAVLVPMLFAAVNLFLGLFNFLPIPPLDGAAMVERILPSKWLPRWYQFRQYGILILFLLVFLTDFTSRVFEPFLVELYEFVLT